MSVNPPVYSNSRFLNVINNGNFKAYHISRMYERTCKHIELSKVHSDIHESAGKRTGAVASLRGSLGYRGLEGKSNAIDS